MAAKKAIQTGVDATLDRGGGSPSISRPNKSIGSQETTGVGLSPLDLLRAYRDAEHSQTVDKTRFG
jgi:hypothetical protein